MPMSKSLMPSKEKYNVLTSCVNGLEINEAYTKGRSRTPFLNEVRLVLSSWSFIKVTRVTATSFLKQAVGNSLHHCCSSSVESKCLTLKTWLGNFKWTESHQILLYPWLSFCVWQRTIRTTFPRSRLILDSGSIRMQKTEDRTNFESQEICIHY